MCGVWFRYPPRLPYLMEEGLFVAGVTSYGTSTPTLKLTGEGNKEAMSSDIRNKYLGKLKAKEMRAMMRNKNQGSVVERDVTGAMRIVHNVKPGAMSLLR